MGGCANRKQINQISESEEKKPTPIVSSLAQNTASNSLVQIIQDEPNTKTRSKKIDPTRFQNETNEGLNAVQLEKEQSKDDVIFIKENSKKNFLFTDLTETMLIEVVNCMKHFSFEPDQNVFREGDPGRYFYIVIRGTLNVMVKGKIKGVLESGQTFGELALINDTARTATIVTTSKCELWVLDRDTFRKVLVKVNKARYEENKYFIRGVSMFQLLTEKQQDNLVSNLARHKFDENETIIHEGDPGELFYIIKKGEVRITCQGVELRKMQEGDYFGEQALLYDGIRTSSVTAVTSVELLSLSRDDMNQLLGSNLQFVLYKNSARIALDKSPYLQILYKDQLDKLASSLAINTYRKGETVIQANQIRGSGLWIVLKGSLGRLDKIDEMDREAIAQVYDSIGDKEVLNDDNDYGAYGEDIVSLDRSDIGYVTKAQFEQIIGGNINSIAQENEILKAISQIALFKTLSITKKKQLAMALRVRQYNKEDYIITQGDEGQEFFIVKKGSIHIIIDNLNIRTLTTHAYLGERSVLSDETRSASAVAAENGTECWTMNKQDFIRIIDQQVQKHLLKRMELQDDTVELSELKVLKELGKGMFGSVFLCSHKTKNKVYAVKGVSRKKVDKFQIHENLICERNLLLMIDHAMIMKLVKTFKDDERVYFLMEYIHGIDLFDAIREINLVNDAQSKFFVGCLVLALEHLFQRDIIHRDLKPENVMVDEDGYARLIDFGTAKVVKGRTYTIIGTPHYMANEVIMGKGYNLTADLWSLGIMLYEFIAGGVPFGEDLEDTYQVYEAVLNQPLSFPKCIKPNNAARNIIVQLVNRNPVTRGTATDLKKHVWFRDMDWEQLSYKSIRPPYRPRLKPVDAKHYIKGTIQSIMKKDEAQELLSPARKKAPAGWDADF